MAKIGFIGMGNMGTALLKGALGTFSAEDIVFTAKTEKTRVRVSDETGVTAFPSNAECANNCKYLILAVKPQYYDAVLKNIQYAVTPDHVIISLAPGITIAQLKEKLGNDKRFVRAMPNTPAMIGEGVTGIAYDENDFDADEIEVLDKLFSSVGEYAKVEERLMSAVVVASGSSPAFVYMFIEALADGAVECGMPRKDAYKFAAKAVAGAAEMVLQTGKHPGELKDAVCSPGGTTIAGVAALEEGGFRSAVIKACEACFAKAEKLG